MQNDFEFEYEKPELISYEYFGTFFSAGSGEVVPCVPPDDFN